MIFPVFIIITQNRKQHFIRKLFDFGKELKNLSMRRYRQKIDPETSTLIGTTTGRRSVYTPDNAKHVFVCGTTGSGKTVALSNYIKSAIEKDYPLLVVDGKGDVGNSSILDIIQKLNKGKKKLYVVNLTHLDQSDKYNPFKNATPTIAKDMLINMTDWSEEHYKLNTERYLQRLVTLLHTAKISLSFKTIIKYMPVDKFMGLSAKLLKAETIDKFYHTENTAIANTSGKIAESAIARFSTIAESEIGCIFAEDGEKCVDILDALKENAIILFVLNPLIYPVTSQTMGRLVLIDSKKAVSNLFDTDNKRTFFIMDEINTYASTALIDLINKSRSANVTCIVATQSLSDLDFACGEAFKEQVIENCNNYIVLRQNSSLNAEHWAKILGTMQTMSMTYQMREEAFNTTVTGYGSARKAREFYYHPDEIKEMATGKGVFMSRDIGYHTKVKIHKPF